jgi:hypothetical protein
MFIFFILCPWIWVLTVLYLLNIIPYSLLYLSGIAVIFSSFYNFFYLNTNVTKSVSIIIFELIIYYLNYYKHIIIDKKEFISYIDIKFNICIVIFYVIFLYFYNRTPFSVYGTELKNLHKNKNETIYQYVNKRASNMFSIN